MLWPAQQNSPRIQERDEAVDQENCPHHFESAWGDPTPKSVLSIFIDTVYFSMSASPTATANRQTRKRLATRQRISDVATRLFFERGFDSVTIEEIAEAADVSRMTVFNHFPRKEDMFFDLDGEGRQDLLEALKKRKPETSSVEALRRFAHWAVRHQRPYVCFFDPRSDAFMATLQASATLKARARAIRDELTDVLAVALASSVKRVQHDPLAGLAASLLVATWATALIEAHQLFQQSQDPDEANLFFLSMVDRGTKGVKAVLKGTPYA
jgi:AcrR family transcriptional regulator